MPKIINVVEFKKKMSSHIRGLKQENSGYIFIANETSSDQSFFVVAPYFLKELADRSHDPALKEMVEALQDEVTERVSRKYKDIADQRWSKPRQ